MPASTPVWGLPYPCFDDGTIDPAIFCEFAEAADSALQTLEIQRQFALNRPNAKLRRDLLITPTFPVGATTTFTWDVEEFDNDGMITLAPTTNNITINTDGVYRFTLCMGNLNNFTTITQYTLLIQQNGTTVARRKFRSSISGSPFQKTLVSCMVPCASGDVMTGLFNWAGTGGPATDGVGWFSATYFCDLV